ncbi:MAG: putative bifunctional diguanylate cyclase/phosphodiesterase [Woeseiaceae bacterium]
MIDQTRWNNNNDAHTRTFGRMIYPEEQLGMRLIYLGEMSVPARSLLRELSSLSDIQQVIELTDTDTLLHHLAAHRPDVVLVDVGITEHSVNRYPLDDILPMIRNCPVVALTSNEREQRGIRAVLQGALRYLCVERSDEGRLQSVLTQCRDQYAFVDTLSGRNEVFATIVDGLHDGAIVVNAEGRVISTNPAARRLLGVAREGLEHPDWTWTFCRYDAESGQPLTDHESPLRRVCRGERFSDLKLLHRSEQAADMIFNVNGHGLRNQAGEHIGGIVSFRDVTEHFHREQRLAENSLFDNLTGIANERLFDDQLHQAVARAERSQRTLGVMLVDLDRFKVVNDSLGHDVGDQLLQATAHRLQSLLRNGDLLARRSGDKFIIAIENLTGPRDAAATAQKVIRGLSEQFACGGNEIYISPSVGIALYPEAGEDAKSLLAAADRAMYQAKRNGGARLQFYSAAQAPYDEHVAELEMGVKHALLRRELTLRYQPRVNLSNGRLMGLETLLRWQHPRFGLLPPARFLSLLESSGLIHSVGEWIIKSVCAQLHAWQQRYGVPDLTVSINLSPMQLTGGRLISVVEKAISDYQLDPGCIEFELGDGAGSLQRPRELETIQALRKLGVGITLDHFGTHDISFAALDSTVISSFVLHQSLIQDVTENESHQRIVRAAIAMAEGLDIAISAEGVETSGQLDFLRNSNCAVAQGHFISQPMESHKINALLHTESLGGKLVEATHDA